MKNLLLALFLGATLASAAPTTPNDVVYKPTFLTGYDSLTAGTGFVARVDGVPVFVTAHHLFGPAAGLERDLSPAEAKNFALALAACSMNRASLVLTSSEMMLIPSAKAFDQRDVSHDVAAFRLTSYDGPCLAVALTAPKAGEKVYLLGRPRGEEKLRLVSAVVSRSGKDALEYFYDEPGINFAGTSGAPVVNEKGEVVAINIGGGELKGRTFGFGNPSTSFAALIVDARKR